MQRQPGHRVLLLHAIDTLDHPEPQMFEDKVIPMRRSFQARLDTVSRMLNHVAEKTVLTEQYLPEVS